MPRDTGFVINEGALDNCAEATSLLVMSALVAPQWQDRPLPTARSLRPRVEDSRAVEPTVDVVWGESVAGQRAYDSSERTPREALALRLFVWISERDDRLAIEARSAA